LVGLTGLAVAALGCGARSPLPELAARRADASADATTTTTVEAAPSDDLSRRLCECMRGYCWTFHPGTLLMPECIAAADTFARHGSPVAAGDFIECRLHFCTVHITSFDDDDCRRGAGELTCVE
jgi:hypothetical protein